MADIKETWARHATDITNNNMAGLMGDFTPAGLAKAMVIAATPIVATSYEVKDLGNNEAEITYIGTGRRVIWSKWEDTGGKFQITDLAER